MPIFYPPTYDRAIAINLHQFNEDTYHKKKIYYIPFMRAM